MALTKMQKVALVTQFERAEGYPVGSILNVIIFETAGTLRTDIYNAAGSGAVGLFQFMPSTLRNMGYNTAQVAAMSFEEQLQLCKKYLAPYRSKLLVTKDQLDFYLAVLYPVLMGKPDNYIMAKNPTITYLQNKGLDIDKDGDIEKGDIRKYFYKNVDKFRNVNALDPVTVTAAPGTFAMLLLMAGILLFQP